MFQKIIKWLDEVINGIPCYIKNSEMCTFDDYQTIENPQEEITEDNIRNKAYYLWENSGKPDGMADYFWLQAEEELAKNSQQVALHSSFSSYNVE